MEKTVRRTRYSYPVVIEQDDDGFFVYCPILQGCFTQGDTFEEAMRNIEDAIALSIQARRDVGDPIPKPKGLSFSTVQVLI
jgi:predicted RNase H-like HicB family nuclease